MTRLLLLLLLAGCAHADNWTRHDTYLFTAYAVAGALDTNSTSRFQYHDDLVEINPIIARTLGENPRTSDLWQGYASVVLSNYFIARALPLKWRRVYLGAWTFGHGAMVWRNCRLLRRRNDSCLN